MSIEAAVIIVFLVVDGILLAYYVSRKRKRSRERQNQVGKSL